ncbi:MAG: glycosyltransferase [candidate division Zixibacteria bacterium]|nr:glycosyltransferase [candidate division Zixibacteria bacterium]
MKILFLSDAKSRHTKRWVDYFVDRGHQCFLISLEKGTPTKAEEFLINSKNFPSFLKYPLSVRKVKKVAEKIKPDLINAHFVPSYGLVGAMLGQSPLVVSTWGSDILISPQKSVLHKLRAKYVLKKADLLTTDAGILTQAILDLGIRGKKVIQNPMGVDKNLIFESEKKKFDFSSLKERKNILILSNRRLEPVYDVRTLLKAVPVVIREAKKRVKFVIVGEGSQRSRLTKFIRDLRVEEYVQFKGELFRKDLMDCYKDSDIYVSTSLSDSTSVSLLEAMALGLIPIVTDIPGNREWIEDKENGFLFPISDHQTLAKQIIYAINEFTGWTSFREKNISLIKKKAIWENNMKAVEKEFLRLVERDSSLL